MKVYEVFGSNYQGVDNLNLPLTAFYKLAAPSTPESARAEVAQRAPDGVYRRAKSIPLMGMLFLQRSALVAARMLARRCWGTKPGALARATGRP